MLLCFVVKNSYLIQEHHRHGTTHSLRIPANNNSLKHPSLQSRVTTELKMTTVRLKVEIQFSEVTNYRNPRNPPPISRNPHAKSEIQHRPRIPLQRPQKLIIEIHQHWAE